MFFCFVLSFIFLYMITFLYCIMFADVSSWMCETFYAKITCSSFPGTDKALSFCWTVPSQWLGPNSVFCYFRLLFSVWPVVDKLVFLIQLHKYQNLHSVFFDLASVSFSIDSFLYSNKFLYSMRGFFFFVLMQVSLWWCSSPKVWLIISVQEALGPWEKPLG